MKDTENIVELCGKIKSPPIFSIENENGAVYSFILLIQREWGARSIDEIRVHFSEKVFDYTKMGENQFIHVQGQFRTRITPDGYLEAFVWAKHMAIPEVGGYVNHVRIEGKVTKPIVLRNTPARNITVCDISLQIIARYPRVIPCVAWNAIAKYCYGQYKEGEQLIVVGFIQSRKYKKRVGGQKIPRLLNEVSVYAVNTVNEEGQS